MNVVAAVVSAKVPPAPYLNVLSVQGESILVMYMETLPLLDMI